MCKIYLIKVDFLKGKKNHLCQETTKETGKNMIGISWNGRVVGDFPLISVLVLCGAGMWLGRPLSRGGLHREKLPGNDYGCWGYGMTICLGALQPRATRPQ